MFDYIYKKLYILGLYTARYLKRFFKGISSALMKPFKALGTLLFAGVILLKNAFSQRTDDAKELVGDIKKAGDKFRNKDRNEKGFKLIGSYIKRAFSKHGIVLTFVTEILAPAVSFVILIATVNYWTSKNLALQITYNNADVGCVSSEAVFLEAQDKAQQRLKTAAVAGEDNAKLKSAEYAIVSADPAQIRDADAVCNNLIERSGSNITNACGIYIDGDFLCAVKNETDAETVFDNILSRHQQKKTDTSETAVPAMKSETDSTEKNSATVSFAEDIKYIQGLYPDDENTILDAAQLSQKLSDNKKEAVYYVAHKGDTFAGVAGQYNISVSKLRELNPNLSAYLKDGDKVLISEAQDLVRVQLTKTETRTVEIAYNTVEIKTSSLYKGIKKTVNEGKKGKQVITELVTYIGGKRVSAKEVSRVTIAEPVDKKVQVGTKTNPYGTATSYGGRFVWPALGAYSISSRYGSRSMGWHGGIDIVRPGGNSAGLTIIAADSGTVTSAGYHYSWGYNIVINHGNGLSTRYAHMIPGSFKVSTGQRVYAGQPIGRIGSSGNVTGPHLHFEVMVNGNRVDPLPYLGRR